MFFTLYLGLIRIVFLTGSYHLPTPDLGQNFIIVAQTSLTPRLWNTAVEALLAPFLVVILRVLTWSWDSIVRRHRKARPYGGDGPLEPKQPAPVPSLLDRDAKKDT